MKKTLIAFVLFSVIFITIKYLIADTGIYFAFDYLRNKIDINNTSNQVSIRNKNIDNSNHKYLFTDIDSVRKSNSSLIIDWSSDLVIFIVRPTCSTLL